MRHRRDEGTAHRPPGTDQIAVIVRLLHQLLRDDIHHRVPVPDDGTELLVQPRPDEFRYRIAVPLPGGLVAHRLQILRRVRNRRRTFVRIDRRHIPDLFRDPVGVRDDNLPAFFLPEIGKFSQHLLRRPEIERRLAGRLLREAVSGLNDRPVDRVLRIQEVHVACGADRLAELVPEPDDPPVDIAEILHRPDPAPCLSDQVVVVACGLDLKIVVVPDDPGDLRVRSAA